MNEFPSRRWLWTGAALFGGGVVMLAVAAAASAAHAPRFIPVTFFVLIPLCGIVGFALVGIGASKARQENRRLAAQAIAKAHAPGRSRRNPGYPPR